MAARDPLPLRAEALPPRVSIVIRSYNRLGVLATLVERCLAQQSASSFEVVVVEQSTEASEEDRRRLAEVAIDPRVRILQRPPLGSARARNVGVRNARGEILLFMDDDDLPIGDDWIERHLANYTDPNCLGVTGRDVFVVGEPAPYRDRDAAYRDCMTFSPVLRLPRWKFRMDRRKVGVDLLHGGNASIRRSALERFGLWDETVRTSDEPSFGYRLVRGRRPGEYLVHDPECLILRGRRVPGGLDKRHRPIARQLVDQLVWMHSVFARYHPVRFAFFYPVYVYVAIRNAIFYLYHESHAYPTAASRAFAVLRLVVTAPLHWAVAVVRAVTTRRAPTPRLDAPETGAR